MPEPEKLLALPEGQRPGEQWLDLMLRVHGAEPFRLSLFGHRSPKWIHHNPADPQDPYTYVRDEPNIKYVGIDWYIGWWRRDKQWFPMLPEWIDAKTQIHDFWRHHRKVKEAYAARHMRRGKLFEAAANAMNEEAERHLAGFRSDYALTTEFNRTAKAPYASWLKQRYGIDISPEDLPDRKAGRFIIPEHSGFKQLAIFHDSAGNYDLAISTCRHAVAIGWPGDWDRRIDRYTKRLLKVERGTPNRRPSRATRAAHSFCTQCGEHLDEVDLFCGHCGTKRRL